MIWKSIESKREYFKEYYHKRRQEIYDYLGGKCSVCGSTIDLQIDHRDPKLKQFEIKHSMAWDKLKPELDKCQILCKIHHREKTNIENSGITHGTMYAWMRIKCICMTCTEAKRKWNDERNAKRRTTENSKGPYNQPAEHGTYKRYKRGCSCDLCRAANTARAKELRTK